MEMIAAAVNVHGSTCSFIEESFEDGAIAARRRRMEIRRFKMIANSGASLLPQYKRLRSANDESCMSFNEGEMSVCKPDYDFFFRLPLDNDESRHNGSPQPSLGFEGGETKTRDDAAAAAAPSSMWDKPAAVNDMQNSSSGEDSQSASSGSGSSTSSGSSSTSTSSDTTSTSHESNEVDGGSTVTYTADASQSIPSITDSSLQQEVTCDGSQEKDDQPFRRQGSTTLRNQSNLSTMLVASSSTASSDLFANNHVCPPHGMVSVCGRRREMEDAVASVPTFLSLPCDKARCSCRNPGFCYCHFFGVYDGHGGSQAALYCAERLHQMLAEEMAAVMKTAESWDFKWKKAMSDCFLRMDAAVGGLCWKGEQCGKPDGSPKCCSEPIAPETVGSTAVVAVVSSCELIIANCGDSRAVLSRGGHAIALSHDHKPEREDEMARIENAGGRVIFWNGYRVLGVLAMSRAIGDRYLKPYVIADPEVTCIQRTEEDECLILASDGLWDVLSNDDVCDIARKCLAGHRRSKDLPDLQSSSFNEDVEEPPAAVAAALLTKLALARGSSDNTSVVVVDLTTRRKK